MKTLWYAIIQGTMFGLLLQVLELTRCDLFYWIIVIGGNTAGVLIYLNIDKLIKADK